MVLQVTLLWVALLQGNTEIPVTLDKKLVSDFFAAYDGLHDLPRTQTPPQPGLAEPDPLDLLVHQFSFLVDRTPVDVRATATQIVTPMGFSSITAWAATGDRILAATLYISCTNEKANNGLLKSQIERKLATFSLSPDEIEAVRVDKSAISLRANTPCPYSQL